MLAPVLVTTVAVAAFVDAVAAVGAAAAAAAGRTDVAFAIFYLLFSSALLSVDH